MQCAFFGKWAVVCGLFPSLPESRSLQILLLSPMLYAATGGFPISLFLLNKRETEMIIIIQSAAGRTGVNRDKITISIWILNAGKIV